MEVIIQMGLAAVVFYSCFCRLVRTDHHTRRVLRWAMTLKAASSVFLGWAPLLPLAAPREFHWVAWSTPDWVWLMFLAAAALLQCVCAPFWTSAASMNVFQDVPERPEP